MASGFYGTALTARFILPSGEMTEIQAFDHEYIGQIRDKLFQKKTFDRPPNEYLIRLLNGEFFLRMNYRLGAVWRLENALKDNLTPSMFLDLLVVPITDIGQKRQRDTRCAIGCGLILKQGWMQKKGPKSGLLGVGGSWKKRFFVLADITLFVYESDKDFRSNNQATDFLPVGAVYAIPIGALDKDKGSPQYCLEINAENVNKGKIHLGFDNEMEMRGWMVAINTLCFRRVRSICIAICEELLLRPGGLSLEGLFRISGNKETIGKLKAEYDYGIVPKLSEIRDDHALTGVLKQVIREMPEPLLTFDLYKDWIALAHVSESSDGGAARVAKAREIVSRLPPPNQCFLRYLMAFLKQVAAFSEKNMMTSKNLAIVFAPNILRPREETVHTSMGDNTNALATVQSLIDYYEAIWPEKITVTPSSRDTTIPATGHADTLAAPTTATPFVAPPSHPAVAPIINPPPHPISTGIVAPPPIPIPTNAAIPPTVTVHYNSNPAVAIPPPATAAAAPIIAANPTAAPVILPTVPTPVAPAAATPSVQPPSAVVPPSVILPTTDAPVSGSSGSPQNFRRFIPDGAQQQQAAIAGGLAAVLAARQQKKAGSLNNGEGPLSPTAGNQSTSNSPSQPANSLNDRTQVTTPSSLARHVVSRPAASPLSPTASLSNSTDMRSPSPDPSTATGPNPLLELIASARRQQEDWAKWEASFQAQKSLLKSSIDQLMTELEKAQQAIDANPAAARSIDVNAIKAIQEQAYREEFEWRKYALVSIVDPIDKTKQTVDAAINATNTIAAAPRHLSFPSSLPTNNPAAAVLRKPLITSVPSTPASAEPSPSTPSILSPTALKKKAPPPLPGGLRAPAPAGLSLSPNSTSPSPTPTISPMAAANETNARLSVETRSQANSQSNTNNTTATEDSSAPTTRKSMNTTTESSDVSAAVAAVAASTTPTPTTATTPAPISASAPSPSVATPLQLAVALYKYSKGSRDEDIDLEAGDSIQLTDTSESSGWWRGTNQRTGENGWFPTTYVRMA